MLTMPVYLVYYDLSLQSVVLILYAFFVYTVAMILGHEFIYANYSYIYNRPDYRNQNSERFL